MGTVEHQVVVKDFASGVLKGIGLGFINLKTIAISTATAIAVKIGKDMVDAAAKFEKGLANVNTMAKLSKQELEKYGKEIREIAKQYGISTDTLLDAAYNLESAGYHGAQALDMLNEAAKMSVAGVTEVNTAANALIKVFQSYPSLMGDTQRAMDIMFKSLQNGVFTMQQFADVIPSTAVMASKLNISFEEAAGTLAELSKSFASVSEAATGYEGIMADLIRQPESLKKGLKEMGTSIEEVIGRIRKEGLIKTIEWMKTLKNADEVMGQLFRRKEAMIAWNALIENQAEAWEMVRQNIEEAAGATEEALAEQMDTYSKELDRFKQQWEDTKITIGVKILPVLSDMMEGFIENTKIGWKEALEDLGLAILSGFGMKGIGDKENVFTKKLRERMQKRYLKEIGEAEWGWYTPEEQRRRSEEYLKQIQKQREAEVKALENAAQKASETLVKSFEALPEAAREAAEKIADAGSQLGKNLVETLAGVTVPTQRALNLQAEISKYEARIQDLEKRSLETGLSEAEENLLKKLRDEVSLLKMRSYYGETVKPKTEDISNLLNNILEAAKEQKYINEQQLGDIQNGIEIQLRALETREKLKELALEQIKKSDFWGKLTAEQQEKLSSDIGKSIQEYISTTDILLGKILEKVSDLKLSPTIINKIYLSGKLEGVENEVIEEGETVTGRSREESLKELSRRAI